MGAQRGSISFMMEHCHELQHVMVTTVTAQRPLSQPKSIRNREAVTDRSPRRKPWLTGPGRTSPAGAKEFAAYFWQRRAAFHLQHSSAPPSHQAPISREFVRLSRRHCPGDARNSPDHQRHCGSRSHAGPHSACALRSGDRPGGQDQLLPMAAPKRLRGLRLANRIWGIQRQ